MGRPPEGGGGSTDSVRGSGAPRCYPVTSPPVLGRPHRVPVSVLVLCLPERLCPPTHVHGVRARLGRTPCHPLLRLQASHFFWALWALIQNQFSTIDFDFLR